MPTMKKDPPAELWINVYEDSDLVCPYTKFDAAMGAYSKKMGGTVAVKYVLAPAAPKPKREAVALAVRYDRVDGKRMYAGTENFAGWVESLTLATRWEPWKLDDLRRLVAKYAHTARVVRIVRPVKP